MLWWACQRRDGYSRSRVLGCIYHVTERLPLCATKKTATEGGGLGTYSIYRPHLLELQPAGQRPTLHAQPRSSQLPCKCGTRGGRGGAPPAAGGGGARAPGAPRAGGAV